MIFSSLDFLHSTFAKANADVFESPGWMGTIALGGYMFPPWALAFATLGLANPRLEAALALLPSMGCAWLYSRMRAPTLQQWLELLPEPPRLLTRLVAVALLVGATLAAFLLSGKSSFWAIVILLAIAALPWARLAGLKVAA